MSRMTIPEALENYARHMAAMNLAAASRKHYLIDIQDFLDFVLNDYHIEDLHKLGKEHVEAYLTELDKRQFKGSTRRRRLVALRGFFTYLSSQQAIPNNPTLKVYTPRAEEALPRVLTEKEYKKLLETVRYQPKAAAIIELLLQTGIRLSELTQLTLMDIALPAKINQDPANFGKATIKGKGRRERVVVLNYRACGALNAYLQARPDVGIPNIFITKFKTAMTPRAVQYLVEKYLTLAGIENASVHTLRHTFGTMHVIKKTNIGAIKEMMGHRSLDTTTKYIHISQSDIAEEMQKNAL
jgi:site-specific recombinase XerD